MRCKVKDASGGRRTVLVALSAGEKPSGVLCKNMKKEFARVILTLKDATSLV